MNPVYTIENTFDDGYPCVHTSTVFAADNLEIAKERFESYRKCCEILDRCDDYEEEYNDC